MSIGIYQKSLRRLRQIQGAISSALVWAAAVATRRLARQMTHRAFANYGNGHNHARLPFAAQPRALQVGDQLVTGDFVLEPPREGFNGQVILKITGGWRGHEVSVPSRIPIAIWPRVKSSKLCAMHRAR